MIHPKDQFTQDWVEEITGERYQYIDLQRGTHADRASQSSEDSGFAQANAAKRKLYRRKSVQMRLNFLSSHC